MKPQTESMEPILRNASVDRHVCENGAQPQAQIAATHSGNDLNSLYQYLDFDLLIDMFCKRVEAAVGIDGLVFRNKELNLLTGKNIPGKRYPSWKIARDKAPAHLLKYRIDDNGASLGVVEFFRQRQFRSVEVRALGALVDSLVGPLRNASLYLRACQSAYRDALTGVQNRAALDVTLSRDNSTSDFALPLVLMVCDVDRFKAINDNCGHAVGDEVLRQFASALQANTRENDLVYRYGGDEFVIALGNTYLEGGQEFAERTRQSIQKTTLYVANACINLTTTIGLTRLRDGESLDEAFLRADDALLAGKREGKNRVVSR